jgi:hypothetical protein
MKQFEKSSCFKEIEYLSITTTYNKNSVFFSRAPAKRKRPDGVGGWHLQVKHSP